MYPRATGALLEKGEAMWLLTFTGPPEFGREMQSLTDDELRHGVSGGFSDADVVSYIERQIAVAGYLVHRRSRGGHVAAWALTYLGES
jgi:hypothetical protein